jgi:hypothetical protein
VPFSALLRGQTLANCWPSGNERMRPTADLGVRLGLAVLKADVLGDQIMRDLRTLHAGPDFSPDATARTQYWEPTGEGTIEIDAFFSIRRLPRKIHCKVTKYSKMNISPVGT